MNSAEAADFIAEGQGIESVKLEVFSLAGKRVFDSGFVTGNALAWHLQTNNNEAVANGVYLYVVTIRNINDKIVRSELKKLVVIR